MVILETEDQQEMATKCYSQVISGQQILERYENFHNSLSTPENIFLFEETLELSQCLVQLTCTIQIESPHIKDSENESIPFVTSWDFVALFLDCLFLEVCCCFSIGYPV